MHAGTLKDKARPNLPLVFWQSLREIISWLEEELALARPRLMITLGAEVAGFLQNVKGQADRNALLDGTANEFRLSPQSPAYKVVHLVQPGIVMRPEGETNTWPRLHREKHIPSTLSVLRELGLAK